MDKLDSLQQVYEAKLAVLEQGIGAAQEAAAVADMTADNVWMMLATALVFIMHLGFAGVEAGLPIGRNLWCYTDLCASVGSAITRAYIVAMVCIGVYDLIQDVIGACDH